MAKFVYALNQSLDGFIDHMAFAPDPVVFQHFIGDVGSLSGSIYGRRMYETMRYWDEEHPEWDAARRAYAEAWRKMPKWVASRTLTSVGSNATLIKGEIEPAVRALKAQHAGVFEVCGPEIAGVLTGLGLVDEYHIYLHPVVVGAGSTFFTGPKPAELRLAAHDPIGDRVIRLIYVPA